MLTCPNGHQFSVTWQAWNTGSRCPICSRQDLLPCRVYYLLFNDGLHKIGITRKTLDGRWGAFGIGEVKQVILCRNTAIARRIETEVKQRFFEKSITQSRAPLSEFFTEDVLVNLPLKSLAEPDELLPESEAIVPLWSSCYGLSDFSREKVESDKRRQMAPWLFVSAY